MIMNSRAACARWAVPVAAFIFTLLPAPAPPAAAGDDPQPALPPLDLHIAPVITRAGEEFEARLHAETGEPLGVFAVRIEAALAQVQLRSWAFGEGLQNHIALNGEPPVCDIIIYPDGSRMFAVMVLDPPFSSQDYGSEAFVLDFQVETENPAATCILYSGDTPDYEPGDDLLTVVGRMSPERHCAPVFIAGAPAFRRGDADGDARRSLTDALHILNYLFLAGRNLDCADAADTNDDGLVNVTDCVFLLGALFLETAPPWTDCGRDATRDSLPACGRTSC
jgi:hypothetical protein